jgi:hypothetical protein
MATADKKTAKKPKRSAVVVPSAEHPFPFLGEGDAGYFEWGEMLVWFAAPVPVRARPAIKRGIPAPFRGSVTWDGPVLYPGNGDQFIHMHIIDAYPALPGEETDDDDDDDDDEYDSGFHLREFASAAQHARFEADLVAWLRRLHVERPILFAARREDAEAGGTRVGAWHRASLDPFCDAVIPRIADTLDAPRDSTRAYALQVALHLLEDHAPQRFKALPAKFRTWLKRQDQK